MFEGKFLSLKCCTDSCERTFQNYKSLRNHLIFEGNPLNLANIDHIPYEKEQHCNIITSVKRKTSSSAISTENSGQSVKIMKIAESQNLISFNSVIENIQQSNLEPVSHSDIPSGSQTNDTVKKDV